MKFTRTKSGFTLIELMITVAIIGILSALSITLYQSNSRKSRQAEAKLLLAGVYTAEKSFYSEFGAYVPDLGMIGFSPEGYDQSSACPPNSSLFFNHYYFIG